VNLARWCNQISIFKKMSYWEFCEANEVYNESTMRYAQQLLQDYPEIRKYYEMKYAEENQYL
jgi:ABC-type dipeptide/oligopeptide/nickel transport system ATPase subunit